MTFWLAAVVVATGCGGSHTQEVMRIDGPAAEDLAGTGVAGAGDVNGDGRDDVLVGVPGGYEQPAGSGAVFVVFGTADAVTVDLAAPDFDGFRIDGADSDVEDGDTAAGAGDVNGDGLADIVVGVPGGSKQHEGAGSIYVVFGKTDTANVDLATLGTRGFRIDGAADVDLVGRAVAGVGDVNGDGRADVLVGANLANNNRRAESGSAYVVFGKTDTASVDLAKLGPHGFRIDGAARGDSAGYALDRAGDVNGDGRADVVVGAWFATNNGANYSGSVYVVFGKAESASVDLAALGARGLRIDGTTGELAGSAVSGGGDVNGDGRMDVVMSALGYDNGRVGSGSVFVVFGASESERVELAALGARGFRIDGASVHDEAGTSVALAGDVNSDGRADVLVGTGSTDGTPPNSAYVVFGKADTTPVDLAALSGLGFRIHGEDLWGQDVEAAGDVNADGKADVIVGASLASHNGRKYSGSAYVVFGKADAEDIDLAIGKAAP